ncbi:MAG TPA: DUF3551 domain-containing protein [Xanthobacteraceae bacterium]|nr:DUF3551 domain-containing protein [Xanthobacteraceae bacterium]
MKYRIFSAGLAVLLLAPAVSAQAQEKLRKNETYCLQQGAGGGDTGGESPLLCNFETLQQCIASKTANSDWCMLNPAIDYNKKRG